MSVCVPVCASMCVNITIPSRLLDQQDLIAAKKRKKKTKDHF